MATASPRDPGHLEDPRDITHRPCEQTPARAIAVFPQLHQHPHPSLPFDRAPMGQERTLLSLIVAHDDCG